MKNITKEELKTIIKFYILLLISVLLITSSIPENEQQKNADAQIVHTAPNQ